MMLCPAAASRRRFEGRQPPVLLCFSGGDASLSAVLDRLFEGQVRGPPRLFPQRRAAPP